MNKNSVYKEMRKLKRPEKVGLALKAGISVGYLDQLIYVDGREPSVALARRLEKASLGRFRKEDLLPSVDWALIER